MMADRTSLQPPTPQPYQDPYLQHHLHHRPGLGHTSCHHPLEPQTPLEQYRTTLPDSSLYSGGSNERYKGEGGGRGGYVDIHRHSRGDNCSDVDGRDGCFGAQEASYCNRGVLDDSVGQGEHFGNHFEGQILGCASQRDDGCDGDDSSASGSGGDTYHRTDEGCNRDDVFHRTDEGCKSSRDDVFYGNSRDDGCEEKTDEGSNTRDEAFHRTDDIRNDVFPGTDEGCNRDDVFYRTDEGCSNRDDVFYRTDEGCSNRDDVFYSREYVCEERGDCSDGYRDSGSHGGGNNTTDYLYNRTPSFGYSVDNTGMKNSLRRLDVFGGDCDDFGGRRSNLDPLEAQLKPGSWVSPTPLDRGAVAGEGRERGGGYPQDWAFLYSHSQAAGGAGGRVYQQKLDSFSEAFSFRRNVAGSRILNGNSVCGILGLGGGSTERIKTSAYDSHTDSSTLPSPPTPPSPHPFPLVLSPPPTPLPPHSLSPPKLTPPPSVRTVGLTQSSGGGCSGTVQFYPSSLQPLHSSHPSAVVWKLPLSHWLQQSGDVGVVEGNPSNSGYVYCQEAVFPYSPGHQDNGNNTDHYSLQTLVESSFTSTPALHSSLHPSSLPSQPPSGLPQNGTAPLVAYIGTPFPSLLQSSRGGGGGGQKGVEQLGRGLHYTPLPMLNPRRRGTGILSSIVPPSVGERGGTGGMTEEEKGYSIPPCINVGPGFQAELPCCREREEESRTWPEDSASNEELLWKPWEELGKSSVIQDQVAAMLSVCSSSCLPGGGSNTELALHCLYLCHGDTLATLEKLLFSTPSSARDYHYAGSDVWLQTERSLFSKALTSHGKDFPLIQQMVKTKCVSQCVEFYYLSKRLPDKQRKQREQEQMSDVSLPKPMQVVVPAPSLATSFPCKQCGKMFYKIKSRNAHMKIHRQQQDDWRRPGLNPAQNLTSNLGTNLPHCQASGRAYLPGPINNNSIHHIGGAHTIISDISVPNTNTVTNGNSVTVNDSTSNQRGPAPLLSLHHSWDSFQVNSDPAAVFFCDPEVKAVLGVMGGGVKGQILWN